jgi:uncharacterized protein (TIGR02246 family)
VSQSQLPNHAAPLPPPNKAGLIRTSLRLPSSASRIRPASDSSANAASKAGRPRTGFGPRNDPEAVVKNYWPDAILLGTVSPVMSEGTEAIRTYFSALKGSGNKNAIGDRRTIVLDENALVVTRFYEFTRMQDGKPVPAPSRFTMLIVKRGDEWRIAHHHSSPHVQPKT